jgi:hypothetical protein
MSPKQHLWSIHAVCGGAGACFAAVPGVFGGGAGACFAVGRDLGHIA